MKSEPVLEKLERLLTEKCIPFKLNDKFFYTNILKKIKNSRFVLIGEATHGTHEFYQIRAQISRYLIEEKGFMAIAIEGDWPDVYPIHRYVKGVGDKKGASNALNQFTRFPIWMWKNTIMPPFLQWLREYNDNIKQENKKIGFYGLDLYSLQSSMQAVIEYLEKIDPKAAIRAKERYACFDHLSFDPDTYGHLVSTGEKESCIKIAVEQLLDLQHNALNYMQNDGFSAEEEYFYVSQNARLVKNAENYYRTHFEGQISSWNIRDAHMTETLTVLSNHLEKRFETPAKIIVWAHNSHIGDARATEVTENGEINIGQLVREQYGQDAYLIGFSTYDGFVTAASKWDGPAMRKAINPGLRGSYEALFHHVKHDNFMLHLSGDEQLEHYLKIPRLQRAIGVLYRPETERYSHYFFSRLPFQFDTIIHIDHTTALQPMNINKEWKI